MTTASIRVRGRRWWEVAAASCALGLVACTASAEDVRPPSDQLFFPTGLAISPDEHFLFAANANSELRYDSGAIELVNLDSVQATIDGWLTTSAIPDGCSQDPDHRETLTCDETMFMAASAGVRIGNFATDIAVQHFMDNPSKLRVIVPTRGDPSISWADFDGEKLSCTPGSEPYALCDDAHRLTAVANATTADGTLPNEPFGVFADSTNGFAVVTHQTSGAVSLINSPENGDAQIVDIRANLFAADVLTLISAATGVSGRIDGQGDDIVYVGSRTENRIQTLTVGKVRDAPAYFLPSNYFFLDAVGTGVGGSIDTRALQFSSGGDRMYVVNRDPPTVQIYDTSLNESGFPRNAATGASDICREASTITVLDNPEGERAYVTCFLDGQIYVVDPAGQSQVEDIITVGRGPYGIAVARGASPAANGRQQLFVSNFLEDTIAVVDVTPSSATRNRVVLRIGLPRAP
jgi:YVTN family beta-propeller protein